MIAAINQWAFPAGTTAQQAMAAAKAIGYDGFEPAVGLDGPIRLDASEAELVAIRREADALGIRLTSLACALGFEYPLTAADPAVAVQGLEMQEKALQAAHWLRVQTLLLVPGLVTPDVRYDVALKQAREAIGRLVPTAERLHVTLAVENVWNKFLLSPVEMRDFVDSFQSESVGAYVDTGNIILYGYPEQWITILGERIRMVHAKDFRASAGNFDGFVMLLEGDVNWPAVMAALRACGYDHAMAAEYGPRPYANDAMLRQILTGLREIMAL